MTEEELKSAHRRTLYNRKDLEASTEAGCFYCLATFSPSEVKEWWDEGETALCPKCAMDSVIGNASVGLSSQFLSEMHSRWFSDDSDE
jgi:hypothetical protein